MWLERIEKKSILYGGLKKSISFPFQIFYKISSDDKSGVEEGEPIIYAPNHQNALIDPLVLSFTREDQIGFYSRSDIFNNKIIAEFLYFIKMLPIFRMRDGFENLHKNQAVFDKTMSIIANGRGFGIFPEANHAGYRKLRVLKKGISRVAFQTELNYDEELDLKIVPVGIEYEHYYWFRSKVHINYGKAIPVKDYLEEYKENNTLGINSLTNAIKDGILPLIVNIPYSGKEYEAVDFLTEINFNDENTKEDLELEEKVSLDQKIVENIKRFQGTDEETFSKLIHDTLLYKKLLKTVRTDDYSIQRIQLKKSFVRINVLLVLAFPLYILGVLLNYIPYKLPYLTTRNIKDVQFYATMYFAVGSLISIPLFYVIYFFILLNFFNVLASLLILIAIGFLGIFSYDYWRLFIKVNRVRRMRKSPVKMKKLLKMRLKLVDFLRSQK